MRAPQKSVALAAVLFVTLLPLSRRVQAQSASASITVPLVNGKNGKPFAKEKIGIVLQNPDSPSGKPERYLPIWTNQKGEAAFDPGNAKTFYASPIGFVWCDKTVIARLRTNYSVAEILQTGVLTPDDCGHLNSEPLRGKLLLFVRKATLWELLKE